MKQKSGWKKRLLAFALSAAVGVGAVPFSGFGAQEAYAADMKGISQSHWAWTSMQKMYDQGILSGDAAGNMHPDRAVTRAEFVSMLNRAFNYTEPAGVTLPYTDMNGDEWYAGHIRTAYAKGYFSGVSADRAGATQSITREAAAAMLCRNIKVENNTLQLTQFTDGTKVSQWSRGAVGAAVDKGYLNGYENNTFRPQNLISRAEAATMLANALGSVLKESGTYSGVYSGNVTISTSNVILKDAVISGDLYITEGVGTGYLQLENVTVLGEVIVCGGGEAQWGGNSVEFKHCNIQKLTVDGSKEHAVSLYATGDTTIAQTNIKSTAYLQNHADTVPGFDNVRVSGPADTTLYLSGNFKMVDLMNPNNKIVVGKGEVTQLTVDEDAKESTVDLERGTVVKTLNLDGQTTVSGKGDIANLVVTTNDATVEQMPDQIEIRPGVTATIDGQEMSSADAAESSESPRILAGYPKAKEVSSATAKVQISGNKPGTIYWALTYGDVKELTQEEIRKPGTIERIQKSGTLAAGESAKEFEVALSSLESDAEFTVSAVLVDAKDNVSRVKEVTFRTTDSTKPGFVTGYPKTEPISSHRFDIEAMPLKDGTIYWAVFAKGAAQPTAYQLRSQELKGAIVYGKRADCERNVEYILKAENDKLVEDTSYDVYIMASDGDRDSAIVKLTGVTKDTTPPKFLEGTPAQAKNDAKSVDVTVGSNEEAKVYYVVVDWDDSFPVPVVKDGILQTPELDWEEAKQQVITGGNVTLAGSANLKEDVLTAVKINGLEEETPYHVFMVLEDKSGNLSEVVKQIDIKTKDVTPPKAYVTCDNPIDGKMPVEEPIKIVFSEIAWNAFSQNGGEELSAENLKQNGEKLIRLYDVTLNKEEEVKIDFSKVTNETGEKGATILVFPPEAFANGEGLNSGNRYQFVLNNIIDTSGNLIKKDTRLEIFETVPPLVVLTETAANRGDMDYTFSLTPQSKKTSDLVLFDMLLEANQDIAIEIYTRTNPEDPFTTQLRQDKTGATTFSLGGNNLTSLHRLLNTDFDKFNQLDYIEYGIKVVRVGSDAVKEGWHTTVKIDVTCVAGYQAKLTGLFNGATSVGDGDVSNVNYSTQNPQNSQEFIMEMPFIDNVVPSFLDKYPIVSNKGIANVSDYIITDNKIYPKLMTDRKATMYYVIARKGTLGLGENEYIRNDEGQVIGIQNDIEYAQRIYAKNWTPSGSFYGEYAITQGKSEMQPTFPPNGDLTAETEYEMLMVLKGVPEQLSKVYYVSFKTEPIQPPEGKIQVTDRGENFVQLMISTGEKRAKVDWLILPSEKAASFKRLPQEQQIRYIRNGTEAAGLYAPHSFGSDTTVANGNNYTMTVMANEIIRPNEYVMFAVAQQVLSNGDAVGADSQVFFSDTFTAKDVTPPAVIITTSNVSKYQADSGKYLYKGNITVSSNEPLYSISRLSAPRVPLSEDYVRNELPDSMKGGGQTTFTTQEVHTGTITNENGQEEKAVMGFMLYFDGVSDGHLTYLGDSAFCDVNGNIFGYVRLQFKADDEVGKCIWEPIIDKNI